MTSSTARSARILAAAGAVLALAYLAMSVPMPGTSPVRLEGTIVRADLAAGSKLEGGSRGLVWVRLDEGGETTFRVDRRAMPAAGTRVQVVARVGLFGQRLYASATLAPRAASD